MKIFTGNIPENPCVKCKEPHEDGCRWLTICDERHRYYKNMESNLSQMVEVDINKALNDFQGLCQTKCPSSFAMGDCVDCEINHFSFESYLKTRTSSPMEGL